MVALVRPQEKASDSPRIIRGIASTANRDRHGEVIDPRGLTWKLPVPLLAGHDHDALIGRVVELQATERELLFTARLTTATELARQSWDLVRDGTLTGVSIGFLGLKHIIDDGFLHWTSGELLEISLVAVPSNRESRIVSFGEKSIEPKQTPIRAISHARPGAVRLIKRGHSS